MASQAPRSPKAGTGAFHQSGCAAAQMPRATRPAAGRAGNRAALPLRGPGFRAAWRGSRRWRWQATSYAIALGSNRPQPPRLARGDPARGAGGDRRGAGGVGDPHHARARAGGPRLRQCRGDRRERARARRPARRAEGDRARLRPPPGPPLGAARARSRHHPLVRRRLARAGADRPPPRLPRRATSCCARSPRSRRTGATRSAARPCASSSRG